MPEIDDLKSDLSFVREIVDRAETPSTPASVYFLWAAIVLVGWPLGDFLPHLAGPFWAVAGPLGGVASAWLGARWARRVGQGSRTLGARHVLHWTAMIAAVFLALPLHASGQISQVGYSRLILLLIALAYFTAGLHLARPMLWIGLLVAACYVAGFFVNAYLWTGSGVVIATSLAAAGVVGARHGRP
jgi:hypothetical protein